MTTDEGKTRTRSPRERAVPADDLPVISNCTAWRIMTLDTLLVAALAERLSGKHDALLAAALLEVRAIEDEVAFR